MSMSETLDDPESKQASSDEDTICPTCGDEFKTEGGMKSHHTQAHGESIAKIEHTCEQCGEKYQTETGYADQSRFCSRECWNDWQNGRSKPSLSGENNPAWNGGKKSLEIHIKRIHMLLMSLDSVLKNATVRGRVRI